MHQYKTIAQILLVLSILNLVFAAPIPRVVYNTDNDAVVVAEDMTTVSDRRRGIPLAPGGTTPSQDSSPTSDGSPLHNSLLLEGSAPLQDSAPSGGSSPSSHLSATDGQVPMYDSTTEAPTSAHAHPLSAAGGSPPVSEITEASTSPHHSLATESPVPVLKPTVEGSTNEDHTAVTHDMQNNEGLRSSHLSKPVLKKVATVGGQLAIIAAGIAGAVEFIKWWVKPERNGI